MAQIYSGFYIRSHSRSLPKRPCTRHSMCITWYNTDPVFWSFWCLLQLQDSKSYPQSFGSANLLAPAVFLKTARFRFSHAFACRGPFADEVTRS